MKKVTKSKSKESVDRILRCFSGEDGGVEFVLFTQAVNILDKQAEEGDADSIKLREMLFQFSRFIDAMVLQSLMKEQR